MKKNTQRANKTSKKKNHSSKADACVAPSESPYLKKSPQVEIPSESPQIDTPPELQNSYWFIKQIGKGAQSTVYLAKSLSDEHKVAIKQLYIDSLKSWKEYTLFHREAEVLSSINIPGVVKVLETFECLEAERPCSYIVQDYVEGQTLKYLIQSGYRFSLALVYEVALQLIDILEKLHKHDPPVIHRDIKPSNVILHKSSNDTIHVTLIDFGAVSNPRIQSGGSTIAGTVGYMSPEQYVGQPTPESDIYALAALITYMISGVDPAQMTVRDLRLIIDPYVESQPPALVQTLRRMLEPDIKQRLCDYNELRQRFRAFRNNIYVFHNESEQKPTKQSLFERLKEVKYLCQPGNLDIWQSLPDIPSNRPPLIFKTHSRNFLLYSDEIAPLTDEEQRSYSKESGGIFLIGFIIIFFILMIMSSHVSNISEFLTLLAMCLFGLLIVIAITMKVFEQKRNRFMVMHNKGYGFTIQTPEVTECTMLEQIYREGRKTIATVTSIKFQALSSCAVPSFLISYKFNPPDDDTPNDIVHTIRTHIAPNGRISVGDALPILYTQSALGNIRSMPFPFPLNDLALPGDYHHHITLNATEEINSVQTTGEHSLLKDSETTVEIAPCGASQGQHHTPNNIHTSSPDHRTIGRSKADLFQTY